MSRKKNRDDRSRRPSSPVVSRVAATPARSTFRVAAAQDQLASALPDIIYQAPRPAPRPVVSKRVVAPAPPLSLSPTPSPPSTGPARRAETLRPVQASKPAPDRPTVRPTSVDLRPEPNQTCKARPADSRRSGSGPARDFVPWCSKRS